jgi:C1A family cysteine protease
MNITNKLLLIQTELKAPKNQRNSFGNYNYRSAEDILEAVKPISKKHQVVFKISDELKEIAGRAYIESTAKMIDCTDPTMQIESTAQAIIDFNAKGMQDPQRTGAASSYAKKYAIGNLLLIDDTKDADAINTHGETQKSVVEQKPLLKEDSVAFIKAASFIKDGGKMSDIEKKYRVTKQVEKALSAQI